MNLAAVSTADEVQRVAPVRVAELRRYALLFALAGDLAMADVYRLAADALDAERGKVVGLEGEDTP